MKNSKRSIRTTFCHKYSKYLSLLIFLTCSVIYFVFYVDVDIPSQHSINPSIRVQDTVLKKYKVPQNMNDSTPTWMVTNAWSKQSSVDCKRIIRGDQPEISRAITITNSQPKKPVTPEEYINSARSCNRFMKERGYILNPLDEQEGNFPIAFCITIYKDIEQFERLLRAIYRPQNYYCIHIDKKSPDVFHRAVRSILDCFENVFVASSLVDVRWGEFTVLQADLICMEDLWKRYKKWKYFINLTGQEFPLRTNNEMVEILKSYNGTADVDPGTLYAKAGRHIPDRINYKWRGSHQTKEKLQPPPYDIALAKGSVHVALPWSFVNYICQSWVAKDFLEWLKNTYIPDETFAVTLNNSPRLRIPGQYTGERPNYIRYKSWIYSSKDGRCHGKVVRAICINGIGDVQTLTRSPHLFVNKFHLDFQYFTLDCLEEWLYNRTRGYYEGGLFFNVTPYIYHEKRN